MTTNYFKLHRGKNNICVFFDDLSDVETRRAYSKTLAMRQDGDSLSVWMQPSCAGPWDKVREIK